MGLGVAGQMQVRGTGVATMELRFSALGCFVL